MKQVKSVEDIVQQVKGFYNSDEDEQADSLIIYHSNKGILDLARNQLEKIPFTYDDITCSVFKEINEKNEARYGLEVSFSRSY